MAWFSSHYAADPDRVLDVVLRAAGPPGIVSARDARFACVSSDSREGRAAGSSS